MTNGTKRTIRVSDTIRMQERAGYAMPGATARVTETDYDGNTPTFRGVFDRTFLVNGLDTGRSPVDDNLGFFTRRAKVEPRDPTWK